MLNVRRALSDGDVRGPSASGHVLGPAARADGHLDSIILLELGAVALLLCPAHDESACSLVDESEFEGVSVERWHDDDLRNM